MWSLEQMAYLLDMPDSWSPFSILWSKLLSRFHNSEKGEKNMSKMLISQAVCQTAVSHP